MTNNNFLKAWDAYISDSDEMFTQEEYLAFKNGWCCAFNYIEHASRARWNEAAFPELRSRNDR